MQDRPHVAQFVGLDVPRAPPFLPICLLASLGAEELRIGGVGDGVVGLCVHAGGLVWWLEICPSVSPRRMNSGSQAEHTGTTSITTGTPWTPTSVFVGPLLLDVMRAAGVTSGKLVLKTLDDYSACLLYTSRCV